MRAYLQECIQIIKQNNCSNSWRINHSRNSCIGSAIVKIIDKSLHILAEICIYIVDKKNNQILLYSFYFNFCCYYILRFPFFIWVHKMIFQQKETIRPNIIYLDVSMCPK